MVRASQFRDRRCVHPGGPRTPLGRERAGGSPTGRRWARIPRAEISVPRLPRQSIERPALVELLDRADDEAVALICAPAGYGKTLLLAEWVRGTEAATAWVSMSSDTNDDRRFWSAVLFAMASCPAVPADSTLRTIEIPDRPSATPGFLAEVIDGLHSLPVRVRLVLDDIHEITVPDALHGLATLVRHGPPKVRLVLSSRFDPPLPLARLRLTGTAVRDPRARAALLAERGRSVAQARRRVPRGRAAGSAPQPHRGMARRDPARRGLAAEVRRSRRLSRRFR